MAGYGTKRRFLGAVDRGKMPKAFDEDAKPKLWSRVQIEACLPQLPEREQDTHELEIDVMLGLAQ